MSGIELHRYIKGAYAFYVIAYGQKKLLIQPNYGGEQCTPSL
jgi:hypothetical protein